MVGVPQQIIDPVDSKGVAHDDLGEKRFPNGESNFLRELRQLLRPDRDFGDVVWIYRRDGVLKNFPHLWRVDQIERQSLVVPTPWQQIMLCGVRKWQMTNVVT